MPDTPSKTFERLARLGFAARGVTYGLVGVLALLAAFGSGGSTSSTTGALATLTGSAGGAVVLILVAIGLFGYGLFRSMSGLMDLENEGDDKKGKAKRAAYLASGATHFTLSVYCISLLIGNSSGSSGGADKVTAALMGAPLGIFLVGLAGLIGFVVAGFQIKKAAREEYKEHVRLPETRGWLNKAIKAGISARAVVFAVIGGFLVYAATTADPQDARGIGGALEWLQNQSYGGIILGLIAVGLVCFAAYSFVQARYRVIGDPAH